MWQVGNYRPRREVKVCVSAVTGETAGRLTHTSAMAANVLVAEESTTKAISIAWHHDYCGKSIFVNIYKGG